MTKSNPKIVLALSTYNGEKFLAQQLDSLLAQSYDNFIILVRDDGSKDKTFSLLQAYAAEYPDRFHLIEQDGVNRGARGGFSFLIEYALEKKADLGLEQAYIMFCDQDDIWNPDKVERQLAAMVEAEQGSTSSLPILVHSDLQVVSEQNTPIAKSFIKYQGLQIEDKQFKNLTASNLVTGCTALINESLARKAIPISDKAIMHDWWLAMVATAFGQLIFLDLALVRYRQHDGNTIGAKQYVALTSSSTTIFSRLFRQKPSVHLHSVSIQAKAFLGSYGSELGFRKRFSLSLAIILRSNSRIIQRIVYRLLRMS